MNKIDVIETKKRGKKKEFIALLNASTTPAEGIG